MKLYIGNRNYSSWSMRPGVLLAQAGIEHEAVMVRFDAFDAQSQFKRAVALRQMAKRPLPPREQTRYAALAQALQGKGQPPQSNP